MLLSLCKLMIILLEYKSMLLIDQFLSIVSWYHWAYSTSNYLKIRYTWFMWELSRELCLMTSVNPIALEEIRWSNNKCKISGSKIILTISQLYYSLAMCVWRNKIDSSVFQFYLSSIMGLGRLTKLRSLGFGKYDNACKKEL